MRFIELFAGIGGFRIGLSKSNPTFQCVHTNEIDADARFVYNGYFGQYPESQNIRDIDPSNLPEFSLLTAGFPCQPYSKSGKQKGNKDSRWQMFDEIIRIARTCSPKTLFLENVENLLHIDGGRVFKDMKQKMEALDYNVSYSVINTNQFGVPQSRKRLIIIADKKIVFDFNELETQQMVSLDQCLDDITDVDHFLKTDKYTVLHPRTNPVTGLVFIGFVHGATLRGEQTKVHLSRSHRRPYRIYSSDGTHPTLLSAEPSGRYWVYLPKLNAVRKLSIRECYRIMGFPDGFLIHTKPSVAYRQIGNSICPPMVSSLGNSLIKQSQNDYQSKSSVQLSLLIS